MCLRSWLTKGFVQYQQILAPKRCAHIYITAYSNKNTILYNMHIYDDTINKNSPGNSELSIRVPLLIRLFIQELSCLYTS
jgi:hypothetical protein